MIALRLFRRSLPGPIAIALLVLCIISPSAFSQAQTTVMQDNFHYKADTINGISPSKGTEKWSLFSHDGVITVDGTQASLINSGGQAGKGGHVRARYAFDFAANTVYALKVTFLLKPMNQEEGGCACFGFGDGENGNSTSVPWFLIKLQGLSSDDNFAHSFVGQRKVGDTRIPANDYSFPIVGKIVWNTRTGEAQFYINDQAQIETDWSQKIETPAGRHNVFFEAMNSGSTTKVTNITLTAEPAK